ncbi:MAG: DUF362 domain-containing protein [Thermoplasmata archaeon]|nr:DUF362 domain-containing protein [Thermoplasmata archaeon]
MTKSKVFIAQDSDRSRATRKVVSAAGLPELAGKHVLVKPNFNTADTPPGSTHVDTIRTVVELVKAKGPRKITLADRSGPAKTSKVFQEKGVFALAEEMGFECLILDEMPKDRYVKVKPPGSHWMNGFWFAKPAQEADAVIGLCCLKTHQYGGHFTMSLKLATGLVHRSNMTELHTSVLNQRNMIAEMNVAYKPALVVMDGVDAFTSGGPMTGTLWNANLTFASSDRVALDAAGVAALKMHGTTNKIEKKPIFELDQIRRAAELGLGASSPDEIELVPVDEASEKVVTSIRSVLSKG